MTRLDIVGITVEEHFLDFGKRYIFWDEDNKITLDLTELTIDEFKDLSKELKDFHEYEIMKSYEVRTITGYDWKVELGEKKPNLRNIFRTIEMVGKRYTGIYYPDIMYYDYENKKMHGYYRTWIEFMGYKLIHEGNVAIFRKEREI